jgi:hypothetical protein
LNIRLIDVFVEVTLTSCDHETRTGVRHSLQVKSYNHRQVSGGAKRKILKIPNYDNEMQNLRPKDEA